MGRLINSTAITADAVSDVGEWFVSEGDHDRAAREQFTEAAAMLAGRLDLVDATAFDSGVTLLRYAPVPA